MRDIEEIDENDLLDAVLELPAQDQRSAHIENSRLSPRAALEELLRRNYAWVTRMCLMQLSDKETALDCAQETMISIALSIRSFKRRSALRTWIFTLTRRGILKAISKRKSPGAYAADDALNTVRDPSPASSDLLIEDQTQRRLLDLVRSLPERQRESIMLHYFEDRPVEEGAAIMDCSVSTFKVLLHQGRKRLGTILEKEEL